MEGNPGDKTLDFPSLKAHLIQFSPFITAGLRRLRTIRAVLMQGLNLGISGFIPRAFVKAFV